jgi:hypothetical protein
MIFVEAGEARVHKNHYKSATPKNKLEAPRRGRLHRPLLKKLLNSDLAPVAGEPRGRFPGVGGGGVQ